MAKKKRAVLHSDLKMGVTKKKVKQIIPIFHDSGSWEVLDNSTGDYGVMYWHGKDGITAIIDRLVKEGKDSYVLDYSYTTNGVSGRVRAKIRRAK